MNKKISVIIPAYNIEGYIEKCICSVINQSYKNIEIIVIDDGSTDGTGKICDRIAETDTRVTIIHQKNQGLSMARNNGIKIATGDYISLIDGDDFVDVDFLLNMESMARSDVDIIICGYKTIDDNGKILHIKQEKNATLSGEDATIRLLTRQEDFLVIAWNKLYKKNLFCKNNIWYPAGRIHEDNLTTYKLLGNARKVTIIDASDYSYVKRAGSITDKSRNDLQIKEKINAAKDAVSYFAEDNDLCDAAKFSLLLAKIIELNEIIKSNNLESCSEIISDILSADYNKNKFCTTKCKLYIQMLRMFSGKPYIVFRKIVNKIS